MTRMLILFLLAIVVEGNSRYDSSKCNDFCCQTDETSRICESIEYFFKDGWRRDNVVDESDCKQCMREYTSLPVKSVEMAKFLKESSFIICESLNRCKRKEVKSEKIIFGDERCTWGPKFWCSSMESAAKCQKYPYCGQEWMSQRLASQHFSGHCLTCQTTLSNIHFKGDALKFMREKCLGSQYSSMTQYLIELITLRNLSHGGVSPAVLCNKLGMCEGVPVKRELDGPECYWAHAIWIRTRQLFSQGFRDYEELLDLLLSECDNEITDCQQAVIHFLPTFISKYSDQLLSNVPNNGEVPCAYVGACSQTYGGQKICEACQQFVNGTRLNIVSRVKKLFNFVIADLCRFTGPVQTSCIMASYEMKKGLVSLIDNVLCTKRICLPFCGGGKLASARPFSNEFLSSELAKQACGPNGKCELALAEIIQSILNSLVEQSMCNTCRSISEDDLKIIMWDAGNSSQKIERQLPELCYLQPAENRNTCLSFVHRYSHRIAQCLIELEPQGQYGQMCDLLGICAQEEQCMLCDQLASELDSLIPNPGNTSVEELSNALAQACASDDKCEAFVANYNRTISALIINHHVQPTHLCHAMGLCRFKLDLPTCEICRIAVMAVEHALARNITNERIVDWVRHECTVLPKAYQQKCVQIVEDNLPAILKLASIFVRPELICFQLGLCNTGGYNISNDYHLCSVCQLSFITSRAWIRSNQIIPKLLNLSEKICRIVFNGERAEDCVDAANSVSRLVTHWLVEEDPLQICRTLKFCPEAGNNVS